MKKYTPNFADPRVKKRCISAFNFVITRFTEDKPRFYTKEIIDKKIGYTHKPLGAWLRQQLLTQYGTYSAAHHKAKQWLLRPEGVELLAQQYELVQPSIASNFQAYKVETVSQEFSAELQTGNWTYKESSNRLWNPAQNIPTDIRADMFARAGYIYNYDIVACAPTLIKQYAIKCGMTRPTRTLDAYLLDRSTHRNRLAQLLDLDVAAIKRVINAKFAGARTGRRNTINELLKHDQMRVAKIVNDEWFVNLLKDIKKCWDAIKKSHGRRLLSSKDKWAIYFSLERTVMRPTISVLKKQTKRYFLEHDGFRTDTWIDPYKLKLAVQNKTNYTVEFEYQ